MSGFGETTVEESALESPWGLGQSTFELGAVDPPTEMHAKLRAANVDSWQAAHGPRGESFHMVWRNGSASE